VELGKDEDGGLETLVLATGNPLENAGGAGRVATAKFGMDFVRSIDCEVEVEEDDSEVAIDAVTFTISVRCLTKSQQKTHRSHSLAEVKQRRGACFVHCLRRLRLRKVQV